VDLAHRKKAHAESSDQFSCAGTDVARAYVRAQSWIDLWRETADTRELRRAQSQQSREWHSVNIAGRRAFGRVHVGVRLEPDQAESLFVLAIVSSRAGKRSDRDRMIAADNDRKLSRAEYRFNFRSKLF